MQASQKDIEALIEKSLNLKCQPKAKPFIKDSYRNNIINKQRHENETITYQSSNKSILWLENVEKFHDMFSQKETEININDDEFGDFQTIKINAEASDDFGEFVSINCNNNKPPNNPFQPNLRIDQSNEINPPLLLQPPSNTIINSFDHKNDSLLEYTSNIILETVGTNNLDPISNKSNNSVIPMIQNNQISGLYHHKSSHTSNICCETNVPPVHNKLPTLINKGQEAIPKETKSQSSISQKSWEELSSSSISDITSVLSLELCAPLSTGSQINSYPNNSTGNFRVDKEERQLIDEIKNFDDPKEMFEPLPKSHVMDQNLKTSEKPAPHIFFHARIDRLQPVPNCDRPNYCAMRDEISYPSFDVWIDLLDKCKGILDTFALKLQNLGTGAIRYDDMMSSPQLAEYVKGIQSTSIQSLLDDLESLNKNIGSLLRRAGIPGNPFSSREIHSSQAHKFATLDRPFCRICFLQLCNEITDSKNNADDKNECHETHTWEMVKYDGKDYHLSCINLWLNGVGKEDS